MDVQPVQLRGALHSKGPYTRFNTLIAVLNCEQEAPHFHLTQGLTNYVTGPVPMDHILKYTAVGVRS